jgi:putative ABC transport system permease protein
MNVGAILKVALRALTLHKMRSFLTVLGVIIGVGAVIAMVAIGEGAKAQIQASFEKMGTNLLVVRSGSSRTGGFRGGAGSQPSLTWGDLEAIRSEAPSVALAAPSLRASAQLLAEGQNWATSVEGTTPEYFTVRNWKLAQGDLFTQQDVDGATKVAVLGGTVADTLFGPGSNPVGMSVRVNNIPFMVVGVTARKGQAGMGQDADDVVWIPSSTFASKIQGGLAQFLRGTITVGAVTPDATARAQQEITQLLRQRHRIRPGAEDDFSVQNLEELASARKEGTETMTRLLAGIALVSLLVGGIGIMNIMLVSVTERTREIGLRMAVGAKPRHVRWQFVLEAMLLSLAGGLIGVALGVGAAAYLGKVLDWPTQVSPLIVAVAVGSSALVGIGFGWYPALKASRLDPIQALRFES